MFAKKHTSMSVSYTHLADKIVVLEGGCVVEQGSPAELREKPDGRYRRMLELQRESEAWVL